MDEFEDSKKLFQRRKVSGKPSALKILKQIHNNFDNGEGICVSTLSRGLSPKTLKLVNEENSIEEIVEKVAQECSLSKSSLPKRKNRLDVFRSVEQTDNEKKENNKSNTEEIKMSDNMKQKINSLIKDINRRTSVIKENLFVTNIKLNSDSLASNNNDIDEELEDVRSLNSFVDDLVPSPFSTKTFFDYKMTQISFHKYSLLKYFYRLNSFWKKCNIFRHHFDPRSFKYLIWLSFLSICFLYNAFVIPLRAAFPYQTSKNLHKWLICDYFCDIVYIFDMVIVKPRLRYLSHGTYLKDGKQMLKHYLYSSQSKRDILSILPLDLFYFNPKIGPNVLLRLNRIIKYSCYHDLFNHLDRLVKNGYSIRITKTIGYLIYIIHLNSCIFYSISKWIGFGSTRWTYNGKGFAYIRCFYYATQLATLCGSTPDPTNIVEIAYTMASWMVGVFITAILLGQIRHIVATANKNKAEFREAMDKVLGFCKDNHVPKYVQKQLRNYFHYVWEQQKTLDESKILQSLSRKLQVDLEISVHYETLSKVQIFQECEKAFLRSLVTKLKPLICLPGSYVCKKGEIIREMFIVSKGILHIHSGEKESETMATLKEGSVFGENDLLSDDVIIRWTVDVVSKGYSNLFILHKFDLNKALEDYPDARKIIKRLTRKTSRMQRNSNFDITQISKISTVLPTPKLFKAVATVAISQGKENGVIEILAKQDDRRNSKFSVKTLIGHNDNDSSSGLSD